MTSGPANDPQNSHDAVRRTVSEKCPIDNQAFHRGRSCPTIFLNRDGRAQVDLAGLEALGPHIHPQSK